MPNMPRRVLQYFSARIATTRVVSIGLVAALLCVGYAATATAQWMWRDENGRVVVSDRAPPASVKPSQIVRQPSGVLRIRAAEPEPAKEEGKADQKPAANAPGAAAGQSPPPKPAGPQTLAERELDYRKRIQERADADKKSAEESTRKQQLAQDCERARGYLRSLEDGRRIVRTDAQGNQIVLEDDARAAEIARSRERISRDCN